MTVKDLIDELNRYHLSQPVRVVEPQTEYGEQKPTFEVANVAESLDEENVVYIFITT